MYFQEDSISSFEDKGSRYLESDLDCEIELDSLGDIKD